MKVVHFSPSPPLWAGCPELGSAEGQQAMERLIHLPPPHALGHIEGVFRGPSLSRGRGRRRSTARLWLHASWRGSLEPWLRHLHGAVSCGDWGGGGGTGSNVQAPGSGLIELQSGGAGGPRSQSSPVGPGRKPSPGSSDLFPAEPAEQAPGLGLIPGLAILTLCLLIG